MKKCCDDEMEAEGKYLIVGLGNYGEKYKNTRHNAGFLVAGAFAEKHSAEFVQKRYADVASIKLKNKHIILIKPLTYMNLSGKAVDYFLKKENISVENLLIIADDIALPFGQVRIRRNGSSGGHNGLQNIIDVLGHSNFARMRIGIGNNFIKGYQVEYVLGNWNDEEKKSLPIIINHAINAIESYVFEGINNCMNKYNKFVIEATDKN